jgi:KR domain
VLPSTSSRYAFNGGRKSSGTSFLVGWISIRVKMWAELESHGRQISQQMHVVQALASPQLQNQPRKVHSIGMVAGTALTSPAPDAGLGGLASGTTGLLRSAAAEHPNVRWECYDASALDLKPTTSRLLVEGDVFGCVSAGGMWLVPRLEENPAGLKNPGSTLMSLSGSIAVTGGLGGIGMLVAAWLTQGNLEAHIQLLGRTGHGSQQPHWQNSAVVVSAEMWDASCKQDFAAMAHHTLAPSMSIHSGGLIKVGFLTVWCVRARLNIGTW